MAEASEQLHDADVGQAEVVREAAEDAKEQLNYVNFFGVLGLHALTIALAVPTFSWGALTATLILVFLCALGWSVGLHRCNVHRSFECPKWLRYLLSYLGTLGGIGGPIAMWRSHSFRDYYQNLPETDDVHGYHTGFLNSFYKILLTRPFPEGAEQVPEEIENDRFMQFLDRTHLYQHIPVAIVLYLIGGWSFVVWGVIIRMTITIDLFALVNYLGHASGYKTYRVAATSEDGRNNYFIGYLALGEGWHNNHHAYPGSAKIGIKPWEVDLGYAFIRGLERLGLAWNVQTPDTLPLRKGASVL